MNFLAKILSLLSRMLGLKGHRYITTGVGKPDNEHYYYFKVLSDATVTYTNKYGGDDLDDELLAAGDEVYGFFTELSVSDSGVIRAYIA